jgi:hypothetical protein
MDFLERLQQAIDILFCDGSGELLKQAEADRKWLLTECDRLRRENWKLRCQLDTTPGTDTDYGGYDDYCGFIDEGAT